MLKQMEAKFMLSAKSTEQFPAPLGFEVAFFGRSNVGKSSLLNAYTAIKKLAKVSATPGCTREINFFFIDNKYYLVDLPGYGYTRYAHEEKQEWAILITQYLNLRRENILGMVIVDIRRGVTDMDISLFKVLTDLNIKFEIVATKSDKLKKNELRGATLELKAQLKDLGLDSEIVRFSSETGEGKKELYNLIQKRLAEFKAKKNIEQISENEG
ncbi:MAG TPA: ribosome biogenesis GTP-binding protein YihA/YsxC [Candidatus Wallbacteria bacterium]|nr:ribosome biogenesis GTP-binding protein YihA/YsxC [Candidatus Wallbacteria bacterium]